MRRIQPEIRLCARELRQPQTSAELELWKSLRNRQLEGIKFRRQYPMGRFIIDFYCAQAKLAIEIDGDTHAEQEEYDFERTRWLESRSIRVIRFTNREVTQHIQQVVEAILENCKPRN